MPYSWKFLRDQLTMLKNVSEQYRETFQDLVELFNLGETNDKLKTAVQNISRFYRNQIGLLEDLLPLVTSYVERFNNEDFKNVEPLDMANIIEHPNEPVPALTGNESATDITHREFEQKLRALLPSFMALCRDAGEAAKSVDQLMHNAQLMGADGNPVSPIYTANENCREYLGTLGQIYENYQAMKGFSEKKPDPAIFDYDLANAYLDKIDAAMPQAVQTLISERKNFFEQRHNSQNSIPVDDLPTDDQAAIAAERLRLLTEEFRTSLRHDLEAFQRLPYFEVLQQQYEEVNRELEAVSTRFTACTKEQAKLRKEKDKFVKEQEAFTKERDSFAQQIEALRNRPREEEEIFAGNDQPTVSEELKKAREGYDNAKEKLAACQKKIADHQVLLGHAQKSLKQLEVRKKALDQKEQSLRSALNNVTIEIKSHLPGNAMVPGDTDYDVAKFYDRAQNRKRENLLPELTRVSKECQMAVSDVLQTLDCEDRNYSIQNEVTNYLTAGSQIARTLDALQTSKYTEKQMRDNLTKQNADLQKARENNRIAHEQEAAAHAQGAAEPARGQAGAEPQIELEDNPLMMPLDPDEVVVDDAAANTGEGADKASYKIMALEQYKPETMDFGKEYERLLSSEESLRRNIEEENAKDYNGLLEQKPDILNCSITALGRIIDDKKISASLTVSTEAEIKRAVENEMRENAAKEIAEAYATKMPDLDVFKTLVDSAIYSGFNKEKNAHAGARALEKALSAKHYPDIDVFEVGDKFVEAFEKHISKIDRVTEERIEKNNSAKEFYKAKTPIIEKLMDLKVIQAKQTALIQSHPEEYARMCQEQAQKKINGTQTVLRSQLTRWYDKLGTMTKVGFNTTEFNEFSDALKSAANGGSLDTLYDKADFYIRKKTANNNTPISTSGKNRLAAARAVVAMIKYAREHTAELKTAMEQANAGIDSAVAVMSKLPDDLKRLYATSSRPLTDEQRRSAENAALNAMTDAVCGKNATTAVKNRTRRNIKSAFFNGKQIDREFLREKLSMTPEQIREQLAASLVTSDMLLTNRTRAWEKVTADNVTENELKNAVADLLLYSVLKDANVNESLMTTEMLNNQKTEMINSEQFTELMRNARSTLYEHRQTPEIAENRLMVKYSQAEAAVRQRNDPANAQNRRMSINQANRQSAAPQVGNGNH